MKRIIIYVLLLALVLVVPVERMDVGKLEPVQAVWAYRENGEIVLETDTQDRGSGATVEEALADMKERCLGIIYLDTAQFLLVSEDMREQIPALGQHLKGSVALCQWDGQGRISDAAKYLAAHKIGNKLKNWKPDVNLPNLILQNTEKKVENNDLTFAGPSGNIL